MGALVSQKGLWTGGGGGGGLCPTHVDQGGGGLFSKSLFNVGPLIHQVFYPPQCYLGLLDLDLSE